MPRLWDQTIQGHRHEVRDAVVDATAALVAEAGLLSVTMSEIAERSGIGRATLYRYFPDVQAVLGAWHSRQVEAHLAELADIRDRAEPDLRLQAVLEGYSFLAHASKHHHDPEFAALLHRGHVVDPARDKVHRLVAEVVSEAADAGTVRDDVPPDELASYCVHALNAAGSLRSKAAVRRLVSVTLRGLRPVR